MRLDELIPPDDLVDALAKGHVTRKTHPTLPLAILTYTRVCQYDNIWNPVTMTCRGLIVDSTTDEVVAYPFPKIFGTDMHNRGFDFAPPLPDEPFTICEKLDGSLIIVFHYDGRWRTASKGSFISEQAQWAQAWIDARDTSRLDPKLTYLAEAIYPGNRIVVDYGPLEELVLLAAYRPADGTEATFGFIRRQEWAPIGRLARSWGVRDDVGALAQRAATNLTMQGDEAGGHDEEGYVIRFANGQRAKVKLAAYLVLHKLFTGTNERTIWTHRGIELMAGMPPKCVAKTLRCDVSEVLAATANGRRPIEALLERVPDEFDAWVRGVLDRLHAEAEAYKAAVHAEFSGISHLTDRADFARHAIGSAHSGALFRLYDGRDITDFIWAHIRPAGNQPFKNDEDN